MGKNSIANRDMAGEKLCAQLINTSSFAQVCVSKERSINTFSATSWRNQNVSLNRFAKLPRHQAAPCPHKKQNDYGDLQYFCPNSIHRYCQDQRTLKLINEIHWMIHRHPGLLSLPSRSLPVDLFASSSSTISCGLTVMWTMCGVPVGEAAVCSCISDLKCGLH